MNLHRPWIPELIQHNLPANLLDQEGITSSLSISRVSDALFDLREILLLDTSASFTKHFRAEVYREYLEYVNTHRATTSLEDYLTPPSSLSDPLDISEGKGDSEEDYEEFDNFEGDSEEDYEEFDNFEGDSEEDYEEFDNFEGDSEEDYEEFDNFGGDSEEFDNFEGDSEEDYEEFDNFGGDSEEFDNFEGDSEEDYEEFDNFEGDSEEDYEEFDNFEGDSEEDYEEFDNFEGDSEEDYEEFDNFEGDSEEDYEEFDVFENLDNPQPAFRPASSSTLSSPHSTSPSAPLTPTTRLEKGLVGAFDTVSSFFRK